MSAASATPTRTEESPGDVSAPALLALETGVPDDVRRHLEPGDDLYAHFARSYREQDRWAPRDHKMYWRAAIHLWPNRPGHPTTSGIYSHALVTAAQRLDEPVEKAAAALGLSLDSLRKGPALADARKMLTDREALAPGLLSVSVTDYPLPRIWAPTVDDRPDPDAYSSLGGESIDDAEPLTVQLAAALAKI
jgi:hypothetical protein